MFDPNKLYLNSDKALDAIAGIHTRNHWRVVGAGPAYIKLGQRVAYSGADLNDWLRARRVATVDQPAPAAA